MKTARILVMFTLAAILLATAAGCSGSSVSKSVPATTPALAKKMSPPSGGSPSAGLFDSYVRAIQAGIEPHLPGPAISASEAKAKTGISVRLPKNTELTGKLKGIYPNIPPPEILKDPQNDAHMQLSLIFTNGLGIEEEAWNKQPDWAAEAAVPTMNGKPPDETIGAEPILTKVAGFQGMFTPEWTSPGPNPYKLPPQLQWWENGVRYHMLPWKLGYTVEQLMEIANSMY